MSDSLRPHGLQHVRSPCPLPTPRVYSNSCPLIWWCHPTNSSSVIPFSSKFQSFLASGSFQMSQLFASCSQSIGVSASISVLQWILRTDWKWQPTPVFLPGESHGWKSLVGYSPRGRKELDTTEWLHFYFTSLTMVWLDILADQGTLMILLQQYSSKA